MKNSSSITLKKTSLIDATEITLPASKSISNRALIIDALSGKKSQLMNLSEARDTQTMIALLKEDGDIWNVKDAGTTMRFLTAYSCITEQQKLITGTERMQQRPIKILVEALRTLGASIEYEKEEGYPPLSIKGFHQIQKNIAIRGDVSSQYISALLMIAPQLPQGLELTLEGKIGSKPYIDMTLSLMKKFGIKSDWNQNHISISPQSYNPITYEIEPDWSAASYWYSFVAISQTGSILLKGLREESLQGDQAIVEIMRELGVDTTFKSNGALLTKTESANEFTFDFTHCPDLAQTVAVVCAIKGVNASFTGLESLKIKETDRVQALQNELAKINAQLGESENGWTLTPSNNIPSEVIFETYEDHRMAMAFAPLCLLMDVTFDDETVVNKSYPGFWLDVNRATP